MLYLILNTLILKVDYKTECCIAKIVYNINCNINGETKARLKNKLLKKLHCNN